MSNNGISWSLETLAAAELEDQLRVESLRATPDDSALSFVNFREKQRWSKHHDHLDRPDVTRPDALDLAARIELAQSECSAITLASARCMRTVRGAVIQAVLDAFQAYTDAELVAFTVISSKLKVPAGGLLTTVAGRLKASFRSALTRVGVMGISGPLLAFLHGEFDPVAGDFQLHWHGLTTRAKAALLPNLKSVSGYVSTVTGSSPIRRIPVKDRPAQFSYILKAYWPEKGIRLVNGKLKRDRQHQRVKPPFDALYLLWLDRHRLRDITLFTGGYSPRSGGPAAMRRLYLLVSGDGLVDAFRRSAGASAAL